MTNFEKLIQQMQSKGCISFSKMSINDMTTMSWIVHNSKIEQLSKEDWQDITYDMIKNGGSYNAG
jgi:hypothetical protein